MVSEISKTTLAKYRASRTAKTILRRALKPEERSRIRKIKAYDGKLVEGAKKKPRKLKGFEALINHTTIRSLTWITIRKLD